MSIHLHKRRRDEELKRGWTPYLWPTEWCVQWWLGTTSECSKEHPCQEDLAAGMRADSVSLTPHKSSVSSHLTRHYI